MDGSLRVLDGLDPEQSEVVLAPRGPVCVLAGAGTGKTRAITRRIAHLVTAGHVAAGGVLAVTFTARAAGEMRTRLRSLGVAGAQARTFHAAALRQLRYFWPRVVGDEQWELLDGKLRLVGRAAHAAGAATEAEALRDLASEIEWAKACLITPEDYPAVAAKHAARHPGARRTGRQGLPALRAVQEPGQAARLRRPAAARRRGAGGQRRGRHRVPRALPLLRRRRVPGRDPAAAARARRVARRPRRPDRGRRPQPDHLLLHRRLAAPAAGVHPPLPGSRRRPAGTRLPLHPARSSAWPTGSSARRGTVRPGRG